MRYATQNLLVTAWLSWLVVSTAQAEGEPPRRPGLFTRAVSALALESAEEQGDKVQMVASNEEDRSWTGGATLPQAELDGSVKGSSLTERMNSIRRRPVDSNLRDSFRKIPGNIPEAAEDNGELPAVKRRPLLAMPTPVLPQEVDQAAQARQRERLPEPSFEAETHTAETHTAETHTAETHTAAVPPAAMESNAKAETEPAAADEDAVTAAPLEMEVAAESDSTVAPPAAAVATTDQQPQGLVGTTPTTSLEKLVEIETVPMDQVPLDRASLNTESITTRPIVTESIATAGMNTRPIQAAPLVTTPIAQPRGVADSELEAEPIVIAPAESESYQPQLAADTTYRSAPSRTAARPLPALPSRGLEAPPRMVHRPAPPMKIQAIPRATYVQPRLAPEENVLLTNEAPALAFKTAGPRKIIIGKEAVYQVSMMNMGSVDAKKVICSVKLPMWAEVVGSSATTGDPRLETGSQTNEVSWAIDQLPARGAETLTLRLVPRDSRPFDLAVGWAFAPDESMAQIEVQEPKLELDLNGPEEVEYGQTDIYSITLSNPGTGTAENVVLNLLPMTSQQQIAGTRNMGSIKAGERKTIELELTAHQAGHLQVKAHAFADNGLRAEVTQDVLVRRASLEVVVMGPPRNYAATLATYKVRLENTGNATAEDATAIASLPPSAVFVNCTDGGKLERDRGQVMWHVGTLRPGAVRVLEMQCELNTAGENRVDIQCHSTHDLSVTKSITTMVEALADLKLYVNDPPGAVAVGEIAAYEVRIVNRGTKTAENIQMVGYFSEGVEPEEIQGCRGEVSTGQVVFDPILSISPGQEMSFRIAARASEPGNHVFRAELQCRAPETRLAAEEWTKYYAGGSQGIRQASRMEISSPFPSER